MSRRFSSLPSLSQAAVVLLLRHRRNDSAVGQAHRLIVSRSARPARNHHRPRGCDSGKL